MDDGRCRVSNCKIHRRHSNYPSHLICETLMAIAKTFRLQQYVVTFLMMEILEVVVVMEMEVMEEVG